MLDLNEFPVYRARHKPSTIVEGNNAMTNYSSRRNAQQTEGFSASAMQCKRAYENCFGQLMAGDMTYAAAGEAVVRAMGKLDGQKFIQAQSNDPSDEFDAPVRRKAAAAAKEVN